MDDSVVSVTRARLCDHRPHVVQERPSVLAEAAAARPQPLATRGRLPAPAAGPVPDGSRVRGTRHATLARLLSPAPCLQVCPRSSSWPRDARLRRRPRRVRASGGRLGPCSPRGDGGWSRPERPRAVSAPALGASGPVRGSELPARTVTLGCVEKLSRRFPAEAERAQCPHPALASAPRRARGGVSLRL